MIYTSLYYASVLEIYTLAYYFRTIKVNSNGTHPMTLLSQSKPLFLPAKYETQKK